MKSKLPMIAAAVALLLVLPLAGFGVALVGALGGPLAGGCGGDGGVGGGAQQIGGRAWSAEQMTNAHTIVARAVRFDAPFFGWACPVRSVTYRSTVAELQASASQQPFRPHTHSGPVVSSATCPNSPAV